MKNSICEYVDTHRTDILNTLHTLHSMPEPALCEVRTSEYLKNQLGQSGFIVKGDFAKTAVLGVYDTGISGPAIGIRADMDALQYEKDGKTVYIHSCGHDANCTAVLWASKALLETGQLKAGSLKVLFQPAEETLQGAEAVIASGVLEGTQYLVSTHLRSQEELPMGKVSPAVLHGASGHIRIRIYGHEAHGARPHQGANAIITAAAVINTLNALPFNPSVPHSIKPTKISSGPNPFNVIPNYVEIMFDVRAQTNEVMQQIRECFINAATAVAESMGARAEAEWLGGVPAASRCDELIGIASDAIKEALGEEALGPVIITPGGEDFHNYPLAISGLRTTVLGIGAGLKPGLHMSDMTFESSAVLNAVTAIGCTVVNIYKANL